MFTQGQGLQQVRAAVIVLAIVVIARTGIAYFSEWLAFRSAAAAKSQLRLGVTRKILDLGPIWLSGRNSAELTALLTRGVDGLDSYFARYLPQLVLAVMVPLSVGVVILTQDVLSAVIVACTVPLIPVFMILIGMYTQKRVERQWSTLGRLSGHFVDVVVGMTTLKVFGRASAQGERVRVIGQEYRKSTMGVLRISFLSALVLEVLAMLSVALVAVSIGIRLVEGSMTLEAGLLVLILAPEVYLPLRLVGMHFHAAAEGLGAAGQLIDILEQDPPKSGTVTDVPDLATTRIRFVDVTVQYPAREDPGLHGFNLDLVPGAVTALVGASGSGKSTALAVLERFIDIQSGRVIVGNGESAEHDITDFDTASWRANVAWVGQDPELVTGTVADNVRLANASADDAQVCEALAAVGLLRFVEALPLGLNTVVGEGGQIFSAGQTRRVALARAFCQPDAGLVLLDEPTAALDSETETAVVQAITELGRTRTVLLVAHRTSLVSAARHVVDLTAVGV